MPQLTPSTAKQTNVFVRGLFFASTVWHAELPSPGSICAPCSGSVESESLDQQGSPKRTFFKRDSLEDVNKCKKPGPPSSQPLEDENSLKKKKKKSPCEPHEADTRSAEWPLGLKGLTPGSAMNWSPIPFGGGQRCAAALSTES